MLSVAIHMAPSTMNTPNIPETGESTLAETSTDEPYLSNGTGPMLSTDKEITLASLSTARCGFGLTSDQEIIYAVGTTRVLIDLLSRSRAHLGGYDRGYCLDTIEQFDPVENKWILLAPAMSSRRGRVSAATVNNKIFVCGGSDGQKELTTGEYLDLSTMDKWLPIKDLATPVAHGGSSFSVHPSLPRLRRSSDV